jgi:Transposase DDE domain group 1
VIAKVEHHLGELFPRVGVIVTTLTGTNRAVVHFYNQRGTAEQWIKEGKAATHWTRLSCHRFRANEVRLRLGVIAYNLGNLLRRLGLPVAIQGWSLTSLQQRLFKTGGRLTCAVLRAPTGRELLDGALLSADSLADRATRVAPHVIPNTGPGAGAMSGGDATAVSLKETGGATKRGSSGSHRPQGSPEGRRSTCPEG